MTLRNQLQTGQVVAKTGGQGSRSFILVQHSKCEDFSEEFFCTLKLLCRSNLLAESDSEGTSYQYVRKPDNTVSVDATTTDHIAVQLAEEAKERYEQYKSLYYSRNIQAQGNDKRSSGVTKFALKEAMANVKKVAQTYNEYKAILELQTDMLDSKVDDLLMQVMGV